MPSSYITTSNVACRSTSSFKHPIGHSPLIKFKFKLSLGRELSWNYEDHLHGLRVLVHNLLGPSTDLREIPAFRLKLTFWIGKVDWLWQLRPPGKAASGPSMTVTLAGSAGGAGGGGSWFIYQAAGAQAAAQPFPTGPGPSHRQVPS